MAAPPIATVHHSQPTSGATKGRNIDSATEPQKIANSTSASLLRDRNKRPTAAPSARATMATVVGGRWASIM